MWARKTVAASLTAPIYAFLLACGVVILQPPVSGGSSDTVNGLLMLTAAYLAISFPAIVTYGVLTSVFSDWLARRMSKRFEPFVSFGLHIGFGMVLLWLSVGASVLYWIIDCYLTHKGRRFETTQAWSSLVIPVGVVVTAFGIVYLIGVIQDTMQRFYG
ncbi:hypothetical protein [Exiguobacterium aurantiacum]|uniref:Yip1 domain-containing protein n=1 Tax=Exiguobacterium aurantiacum TaxID=33987 RepID=A0ABY5FNI5_9BACL|nr:hypothetical protein [Exiguobacterium aurantiacum]UTT43121.1 hypothetical protein NMQ00_01090 [Exiguobacterium aurantiacum]